MPKIKICGLSRREDIGYVNKAAPDYIGFVFAESRRKITADLAAALREMLRPGIIPVGVFSDHDIKTVAGLLLSGVIDIAQLHGGETEEYILRLKALCPKPVIKAVRVRCKADIEKWRSSSADYLLLDGGAGSGRGFDWNLIVDTGRPFFLAGGIHHGNISAACKLSPYCIDISSGAETDGLKDAEKIRMLVGAVRNYRLKGVSGGDSNGFYNETGCKRG